MNELVVESDTRPVRLVSTEGHLRDISNGCPGIIKIIHTRLGWHAMEVNLSTY